MTDRKGFALLGALWMVTATGLALAAVGSVVAEELAASRNRVALTRGRWAAEACAEVAIARWGTPRWRAADTLRLGPELACWWNSSDPGVALPVHSAPRAVLERLLDGAGLSRTAAREIADSVVARRRRTSLSAVEEVALLAALPMAVRELLTTDGPGTVLLPWAPAPVLRCLPGMHEEAVRYIVGRRLQGRPLTSMVELLDAVSRVQRAAFEEAAADLMPLIRFTTDAQLLAVTGRAWTGGVAPPTRIELLLATPPGRPPVVQRRRWT